MPAEVRVFEDAEALGSAPAAEIVARQDASEGHCPASVVHDHPDAEIWVDEEARS